MPKVKQVEQGWTWVREDGTPISRQVWPTEEEAQEALEATLAASERHRQSRAAPPAEPSTPLEPLQTPAHSGGLDPVPHKSEPVATKVASGIKTDQEAARAFIQKYRESDIERFIRIRSEPGGSTFNQNYGQPSISAFNQNHGEPRVRTNPTPDKHTLPTARPAEPTPLRVWLALPIILGSTVIGGVIWAPLSLVGFIGSILYVGRKMGPERAQEGQFGYTIDELGDRLRDG